MDVVTEIKPNGRYNGLSMIEHGERCCAKGREEEKAKALGVMAVLLGKFELWGTMGAVIKAKEIIKAYRDGKG